MDKRPNNTAKQQMIPIDPPFSSTAKKTTPRPDNNAHGGTFESGSSVNLNPRDSSSRRIPEPVTMRYNVSQKTTPAGDQRAFTSSNNATVTSLESTRIPSGLSSRTASSSYKRAGGSQPSFMKRSQAPRAQDPPIPRYARDNPAGRHIPVSRSSLGDPPSTNPGPPGPSIFPNRKEKMAHPAKSAPTSFERVAFFDQTPASARSRADRFRPTSDLSRSRPADYETAPTLEERQLIFHGPPQDHERRVTAARVEERMLEDRRAKKTVQKPETEVAVKHEHVPILIPRSGARKHATTVQDIIEIESDEDLDVGSTDLCPSIDMLAAMRQLSYHVLRLQQMHRLPFLRRNLRKGFMERCAMNGVQTRSNRGNQCVVTVIYRSFASGDDLVDEYEAHMRAWLCPICELHGPFATREMLENHLQWDHKEVSVIWNQEATEMWRIALTLPEPIEDVSSDSSSEPDSPLFHPSPVVSARHPSPIVIGDDDAMDVKPTPNHLKYQFAPSSMPNITSSLAGLLSQPGTQSQSVPSRDLLGPLAQYPYLPHGDVQFSCRPGGPRLYDLVSALPMEPYGVLSWYIIDKEEELFEIDNTRDEDKVMQALWSRWIFLNRRQKFIPNYFAGTRSFIDEYWSMIHLAAGWAALRVWLFLLVKMRYLTGSEVAQLLRHYERLVEEHQPETQAH